MHNLDDIEASTNTTSQQLCQFLHNHIPKMFVVVPSDALLVLYKEVAPLVSQYYVECGLAPQTAQNLLEFVFADQSPKIPLNLEAHEDALVSTSPHPLSQAVKEWKELLAQKPRDPDYFYDEGDGFEKWREATALWNKKKEALQSEHQIDYSEWVNKVIRPQVTNFIAQTLSCAHKVGIPNHTVQIATPTAPIASIPLLSAQTFEEKRATDQVEVLAQPSPSLT